MRILHIDPDDMLNPVSGGGPIRTFEICRRLVARGHEVTVLTPTFEGSTPELVREGVRYVRLGRRIGNHGSSHHLTFYAAAPRALGDFAHDLLVEDFMPPMGPTFTPLLARRPLVGSVQWLGPAQWQRQFKLPFTWGERLLTPNYRNLIVLTESMRERMAAVACRARIEVIPNAVDASFFDSAPHYGDFGLYLGRLDAQEKGVDLLLRAYARTRASDRLPLVVAGAGWQQAYFDRLVAELGLVPWVSFVGAQSRAGAAELYRTCRFVCVPSRVETFGLTLLEAQASAKPVLYFDRAPMNEVVHAQAGVGVAAFDLGAYADAMTGLFAASTATLMQMGGQGRTWARGFSWEHSALAQERFYQQALEHA